MVDRSKIDNEALSVCLFLLLPHARELWSEQGGEPDFLALRMVSEKTWGKIFSKNYQYFDACIGVFRMWKILQPINHRYSDPIEYIDVKKLGSSFPTFEIGAEYAKVYDLRGLDGATEWMKQILHRILEETDAEFAESPTDEEQNNVVSETKDASDDLWQPLPIDRGNPEFEETLEGLEKAIREIAADNGFSSTLPEERDNFVEHANATLKSVKEGKATRGQIKQNFIAASQWIALKFAGTGLGVAAKALINWGVKLLGFV